MGLRMNALFLVAAVGAVGCDRVSPAAPAAQMPKTQAPAPPASVAHPATTIAIGETITDAVAADDMHCDTADPTKEELDAPCKTFQFTAPRSGIVTANLSWPSSGIFMELLTPEYGRCCSSPLFLSFGVKAGGVYTLSVGFHGITGAASKGIAPFELTTSLTP